MSGKSPGPESPAAFLRRRIARHGPVGFDEFMATALYHEPGGYYTSAQPRTGKRGDFFTSVSVGPVFGKMLAAQLLEMRDHLGAPQDFTLVEQGAHDGQLLADILNVWSGPLPQVVIIEPLASLRARQRTTLAPWAAQLKHLAHESELPAFTGVFLANELIDAFPVKILVRETGGWTERRVDHDGENFVFAESPYSGPAPAVAPDLAPFTTEFCPTLAPWLRTLAGQLTRGWFLLIDYGHPARARYHPARAGGTLAAYRAHQRQEDPLADPGQQDLTSHVDFTAVAGIAREAGLELTGFTDQHHALTALATRVFPSMPGQELSAAEAREMRALRQLLHPESMGTSFKFLALARHVDKPLTAFRFARDPRRELFS